MPGDAADDQHDPLVRGLGRDRAAALRDELGALGLVAVEVERLAELERLAAAHRRMRQLVIEDEDS